MKKILISLLLLASLSLAGITVSVNDTFIEQGDMVKITAISTYSTCKIKIQVDGEALDGTKDPWFCPKGYKYSKTLDTSDLEVGEHEIKVKVYKPFWKSSTKTIKIDVKPKSFYPENTERGLGLITDDSNEIDIILSKELITKADFGEIEVAVNTKDIRACHVKYYLDDEDSDYFKDDDISYLLHPCPKKVQSRASFETRYLKAGKHTVIVKVESLKGFFKTPDYIYSKEFYVNQLPKLDVITDKETVFVNEEVNFQLLFEDSVDDKPLEYIGVIRKTDNSFIDNFVGEKSWPEDKEIKEITETYTFTEPGEYEVWFTAVDQYAKAATKAVTINVEYETVNLLPLVNLECIQLGGEGSSGVKCYGNFSDSDGEISLINWDFGGEGTLLLADDYGPFWEYSKSGNYIISVEVTDNRGGTAKGTYQVRVYVPGTRSSKINEASTEDEMIVIKETVEKEEKKVSNQIDKTKISDSRKKLMKEWREYLKNKENRKNPFGFFKYYKN